MASVLAVSLILILNVLAYTVVVDPQRNVCDCLFVFCVFLTPG